MELTRFWCFNCDTDSYIEAKIEELYKELATIYVWCRNCEKRWILTYKREIKEE